MQVDDALRTLSACVGTACLLGVVLIQEDEQRGFRNRMVAWWVSVTATSENSAAKLGAFTRALATVALGMFDRAFGPRIASLQFVAGSLFVNAIVLALGLGALAALAPDQSVFTGVDVLLTLLIIGALYGVAIKRMQWMWCAYGVLFVAHTALLNSRGLSADVWATTVVVLVCVSLDAINVPVNRWILDKTARSKWGGGWLSLLLVVPCVMFFFGIVLMSLATNAFNNVEGADTRVFGAAMVLAFVGMFALLIGVSILAVMCAFAVNAVVWICVARLLHTLHDRGPSRQHMVGIGVLMIGLALAPSPGRWLAKWAGLPAAQENGTSAK